MFITGYFYKSLSEKNVIKFIIKKFKTILVPFFGFNGVFLVLQTILHNFGFSMGQTFSFYNWIIFPFLHTQPLTFGIATWYLFVLFFAEILYVCIRKIVLVLFQKQIIYELIMLLIFLINGVFLCFLVNNYKINDIVVIYMRPFLMLFFIQLGRIYKLYLEIKLKNIDITMYFIIIFIVQGCVILLSHNDRLAPGLYGMVGFSYSGIFYFITGIIGIMFWLKISQMIDSMDYNLKCLINIGKNTKYIMTFHLFGYFILNCIIYVLAKNGYAMRYFQYFDKNKFFSSIYYTCTYEPRVILIYLTFGIVISMLLAYILTNIKEKCEKLIKYICSKGKLQKLS